jgi:multiple sugar transport system substrate-binding protein
MINNGGGLFDAEGNLDLRNERALETLQFYNDLVASGAVHPASAGYSDDEARAAFGQGTAAFFLDGPGMKARFPEQADNIAILPPLKGPHGDSGTLLWVNNIMMYNQCNDAEAAKSFLTWWSKNQTPLWNDGHVCCLPTRKSIAGIDYLTTNEEVKYVIDTYIPIGKTTSATVGGMFPALNEIEGDGTLQSLMQQIMQGNDLDRAIDEANEKLKAVVGQ